MIVENVVNSTTQQDMLAFTIQNKPEDLVYQMNIFDPPPYQKIEQLPHKPCARVGKICKCDGNIYYGDWMSLKVSYNRHQPNVIFSKNKERCKAKAFGSKKKKGWKCYC